MASCRRGAGLLAERLCLPGGLLVGKEGPPTPVSVGPGPPAESWVSDAAPGTFECGEWVPGAAGLWGQCL